METSIKLIISNKLKDLKGEDNLHLNEISKITNSFICLPFIRNIIKQIGLELFEDILTNSFILYFNMGEKITTKEEVLYFIIKGSISFINLDKFPINATVSGPLNFFDKYYNELGSEANIQLKTRAKGFFLCLKCEEILKAKNIISQRDQNDFKCIPFLYQKMSTHQIERINHYTTRKRYIKNEFVYHEGDKVDNVYLIKRGKFIITKKHNKEESVRKKLKVINSELNILSKQSDLYLTLISGHYTLNSKNIIKRNKEIEDLKHGNFLSLNNFDSKRCEDVNVMYLFSYIIIANSNKRRQYIWRN